MKNSNLVALLLITILFAACKPAKTLQSKECEVMQAVFRDIVLTDSVKSISVSEEYWKWSIDIDVDFKMVGDSLPKNAKERQGRLESGLIDPYRIYYVFAYPFTDTIFSKEDIKFIQSQVTKDTFTKVTCQPTFVTLVDPRENPRHSYLFFKPLFSKDYKYAIIRKYGNYDITKGEHETLFGESQTLYYRYDQQKGWIRIFATPIWL